MLYGLDQVFLVVGTKIIVRELGEAEKRVRQIAESIGAKMLN